MRWQLLVLAVLAIAVVGWFAVQPRSSAPDLVVARDRLVASDAVVADFVPGGAEGYRFTVIRNRGWVWERTNGSDGSPLPDAIIFNGSRYLLRITEGCFVQLPTVMPPLVPGLTISQKLVSQRGLDEQAGGRYAYNVDPAAFARTGSAASSIRVTEDLSTLTAASGAMLASTGKPPGLVWPGDYTLERASPDARLAAERLISEARPSDYAEVVVQERVVGTLILRNTLLGPYRIVIPEACPDHPTMLSSGVEGGQAEGLRSTPAPMRFIPGNPVVIADAVETQLLIRAPVESFNAVAGGEITGTVPVSSLSVIVAKIRGGGFLAFQMDSCLSRPWFVC